MDILAICFPRVVGLLLNYGHTIKNPSEPIKTQKFIRDELIYYWVEGSLCAAVPLIMSIAYKCFTHLAYCGGSCL